MNRRKWIALLLTLLLCLGLTGCGKTPDSGSQGQDDSPAAQPEQSGDEPLEAGINGEVVISHWGGSTSEAYRECYFDDFERETGIKVVEVLATNNMSQLEAMVNTNTVDVDIMQGSALEVIHFDNITKDTGVKYIADLDFSLLPKENVEGLVTSYPNAVGAFVYASVLAYNTDVFPEDHHPESWADFWNVEEFPGMRTMVSGVSGDYPPMEYALMADGVACKAEELYPIDVDRAFAKLDEIKPHILKWWMSGSEAPQMLIDGEVVMAEGFSGRFMTIADQGAPVAIVYNQGMLNYDLFFCPEGCPNYENAHKLLSYMTDPKRQAKFAELTNYAPSNQNAFDYLDPDFAATLVTAPENIEKCCEVGNAYWAEFMYDVQNRWLAWEGEG